jgi:hypothetical protein
MNILSLISVVYGWIIRLPAWMIRCVMPLPAVFVAFVAAWLLRLVLCPLSGLWLTVGCWIVTAMLVISVVYAVGEALQNRDRC